MFRLFECEIRIMEIVNENVIIKPENGVTAGGGGKEVETKECYCCCDTFNKTNRMKIVCPNPQCEYRVCKACARQYILSTTELPHCMDCKVTWNQRFIVSQLNTSFTNNDYKKHRKALLTDRQISMLPETMPAVARAQQREEYEDKQNEISGEVKELRRKIKELQREQEQIRRDYYTNNNTDIEQETRKFILPCPDEECRGFLSTAYKCELCKYYACPKCLVLTGKERHDPDHVCDEELVKTTQLIRESSKPCPTCGERIMKASGCDQMWCTKCQTAFSWKTGLVDKGIIHNPHYFQFQRNNQNGQQIRNPGDMVCGGLPNNWWRIRNLLRTILMGSNIQKNEITCACEEIQKSGRYAIPDYADTNEKNILARQYHSDLIEKFSELFQSLRHINGYELRHHRELVRELDNNEHLRVNYLRKKISKDQMAKELVRRDKKRNKTIEMMHIYEMFSAIGNDLVNHICAFVEEPRERSTACQCICEEFTKKLTEFDTFVDYVNNQFKHISVTYSQTVPKVSKLDYSFNHKVKFNKSDLETSV